MKFEHLKSLWLQLLHVYISGGDGMKRRYVKIKLFVLAIKWIKVKCLFCESEKQPG